MRIIALIVMLTSCAHGPKIEPIVPVSELHHTIGQEFAQVAVAMNRALDEHKITWAEYEKWATFARAFKVSYALATQTLDSVAANYDAISEGRLRDSLIGLSADLHKFMPILVDLTTIRGDL